MGQDVVQLVPVTDELRARLVAVAAADGFHRVIHPTHAAVRGGAVIGYVSCGAAALLFGWMDTRTATARESFTVWRNAEAIMQRAGHRIVCLPCEAQSPFMPFVSKLGYETLGAARFNLKEL